MQLEGTSDSENASESETESEAEEEEEEQGVVEENVVEKVAVVDQVEKEVQVSVVAQVETVTRASWRIARAKQFMEKVVVPLRTANQAEIPSPRQEEPEPSIRSRLRPRKLSKK